MTQQAEKRFTVERKGERVKHKPKPWSHQHALNSLKGEYVEIALVGGGYVNGVLTNADQFTIQLGNDRIIFKHAIVSIKS